MEMIAQLNEKLNSTQFSLALMDPLIKYTFQLLIIDIATDKINKIQEKLYRRENLKNSNLKIDYFLSSF